LRRAVQKYIEDPVSEEILKGKFKEGSNIRVKHKEGIDGLEFLDADKDTESESEKENVEPHENKEIIC